MTNRTSSMLFTDPSMRSPTAATIFTARPFLVETSVNGETEMMRQRASGELAIQQLAAMCDEEVEFPELIIEIVDMSPNSMSYISNYTPPRVKFEFDKQYLSRIWPRLFKLPIPILVSVAEKVVFKFPGRAVVVIAGVRKE